MRVEIESFYLLVKLVVNQSALAVKSNTYRLSGVQLQTHRWTKGLDIMEAFFFKVLKIFATELYVQLQLSEDCFHQHHIYSLMQFGA